MASGQWAKGPLVGVQGLRRSIARPSARFRRKIRPWLFVGPSVLFVIVFVGYPMVLVFVNAFSSVDIIGGLHGFIGLANFQVLSDDRFRAALKNSLIWTGTAVGGGTLVAFLYASALSQPFKTRGILRALMFVPWGMALPISAVVFVWIFDDKFGFVSAWLKSLHVINTDFSLLGDPRTAFAALIGVAIWASLPFVTVVILAGIASIPNELYDAARVDGANGVQLTRHITLPLLRPVLTVGVILNTIGMFNSFSLVWPMTQGGPGFATDIVPTYLFREAFINQDFGGASALSLLVFGLLLVFSLAYVRIFGVSLAHED